MIKRLTACACVLSVVSLLAACGASGPVDKGLQYPPTDKVETIFQINRAPASCRVFSHLFATMPAGMTTIDFGNRIAEQGKSKGADMVLIGQSRQCTTDSKLAYSYYGPDREYGIKEWPGWSFGFEDWGEQGNWANIGFEEWKKNDVHFDYPIVMQVVFLRCRK